MPDLVGYYYGVRSSEAGINRPAYAGRDTVNINAGLGGLYLLNRDWLLLGGIYGVYYGSGIRDSPIVTHDFATLAYFGAGWIF